MPSAPSVCVLISGGLDSAVLLDWLLARHRRVLPLYVRCGLVWEEAELSALWRVVRAVRTKRLDPLMVVDVPLRSSYGDHWSISGRRIPGARSPDAAVYLPGRNLLLLSHAAAACTRRGIGVLALGVLKGNPFPDATPQFFSSLARSLTIALDRPIRILTPFRRMAKPQLIRLGRDLPLGLTVSCLRARGMVHCGACNKCAERQGAFRLAGIADPTRYEHASR